MDMMVVMSVSSPPGVFISMTIAGEPEDLADARAFAIRFEEPGSTGTLKSTTTTVGWPGRPSAAEATEASKRHQAARTNAACARNRPHASFWGLCTPYSCLGERSHDKRLSFAATRRPEASSGPENAPLLYSHHS